MGEFIGQSQEVQKRVYTASRVLNPNIGERGKKLIAGKSEKIIQAFKTGGLHTLDLKTTTEARLGMGKVFILVLDSDGAREVGDGSRGLSIELALLSRILADRVWETSACRIVRVENGSRRLLPVNTNKVVHMIYPDTKAIALLDL